MASIAEIVQTAIGNDNEKRKEAEEFLMNMMKSESEKFVKEMMKLLNAEEFPIFVRQAAGLIMKRAIKQIVNDQILWASLSQPLREETKNCLLCLLMSQEPSIVQTSASLIAEAFSVELPIGSWKGLIPSIASNTKNEKESVRKAAISTLGFICEGAKRDGIGKFIDKESSEQIMSGIMLGLEASSSDFSMIITSLKALSDSMAFFEELYTKKEIRDFVLMKIGNFINHSNPEVQKEVISCLIDYSKVNYVHMKESIAAIFQAMIPLINGDEEIAIPSLELFNSLAMDDKEKGQQVLLPILQFLIPILLEQLIRSGASEEEEFEESDLTLESSAFSCLSSIMEIYGSHCAELLINLVQALLSQGKFIPGLLSVVACLEMENKEKLAHLITYLLTPGSSSSLSECMGSGNQKIQQTASLTYARIAENYPIMFFASNESFAKTVDNFMNYLSLEAKTARNICNCIAALAEESKNFPNSLVLKEKFESLTLALMNNCYRSDITDENSFLISSNMVAIMSLLEHLAESSLCFKYLATLTEKINALYSFPKSVARDTLESGLYTLIHTCVYRSASLHNEQSVEFLVKLALSSFTQNSCVTTDGIYLLCSIINSNSTLFKPQIPIIWPYVQEALKNESEIDLWVSVLGLISDISRRCCSEYVIPIIGGLVNCFENPAIERRVKLAALLCLGDLALGLGQTFEKFIDETFRVMNMGCEAVYQLKKSGSMEDVDYSEELSEAIVESFTSCVHGTLSTTMEPKIVAQSCKLIPFFFFICTKELKPPVDLMRKSLLLLTDILSFFKGDAAVLIKNQFYVPLQNLVQNLATFKNNQKNSEAVNYAIQTLKSL